MFVGFRKLEGKRLALSAIIILLLLSVLTVAASSSAEEAGIIPASEVERGMKGKMLTVISGDRIEEFDIEVIGVIPGEKGKIDYIMVKVSDELVERVGGIASGMSGSPVYIGERLMGAISGAFLWSDRGVGIVTPIERMLELLGKGKWPDVDSNLPKGARPLSAPIMVSGMNERAFNLLKEKLGPLGDVELIRSVQSSAGSGRSGKDNTVNLPELAPGSPIGIQLCRGDIDISLYGTLTYIKDNRFLALGHGIMKKGNVSFLLTRATVLDTIGNLELPFRISFAEDVVGTVLQDRGAGIAGILNESPDYIDIEINIKDRDLGNKDTWNIEVVNDPYLVPGILASAILQATDSSSDRVGEGTADVTFEIELEGVNEKVKVSNSYYSPMDISGLIPMEIGTTVGMILHNEISEAKISKVKVDMVLQKARRTARIAHATIMNGQVAPGDPLMVQILLLPYRKSREVIMAWLEIPKDIQPGRYTLQIRGGEFFTTDLTSEEGKDVETRGIKLESDDLEGLVKAINEWERNTDIILSVPSYSLFGDEEGSDSPKTSGSGIEVQEDIAKTHHRTGYVVEGEIFLEFDVVPKEEQQSGKKW